MVVNKLSSNIRIVDYRLKLHLGATSLERARKQLVFLDLNIEFQELPLACETGELNDTVCYQLLLEQVETAVKGKQFTLIENTVFYLFKILKQYLPTGTKLSLKLTKVKPLKGLAKSVFELTEQ